MPYYFYQFFSAKSFKNSPELKLKKVIFSIFLSDKITLNLSQTPLTSDRNENNQLWEREIKIQVRNLLCFLY